MDFVSPLYKTLQAQATLDQTQATTLDTRALAATRIDALRQQQGLREQMAKEFSAAFPNPTGDPTLPFLTQQPVGGQVQGAAQPDDSPLGRIQSQIGSLTNQASQFERMAKVSAPFDPKVAESYAKEAAATRRWAATESINALKEQAGLYKTVGGIASGATLDTFTPSISQINRLDPRILSSVPFDRAPGSSMPLETQRNVNLLNTMGAGSMSAAERASRDEATASHLDSIQQRSADREQRAADRNADRIDRDANAAANRELARDRMRESDANRDENRELRASGLAQRIGTDYRVATKDFVASKPYFVTAYKYLFDDNGEKRPTATMDSSSDMALRDSYLRMVHPDYKGSVYEKKELDKLASLPTRFVQSFVNLAEGKELPNTVRYEMFNAMKRQFGTANEQQSQLEDDYRRRLTNAKVAPDMIDAWVPSFAVRGDTKATAIAPATVPSRSAAGAISSKPVRITSDAEFDALPTGQPFIGPDGKTRTKP